MLIELKQAHTQLLGFISELEAILAAGDIDASGRSRRLVPKAVQHPSANASVEEIRRLNLLRENDAILAATSSHVGGWSIDAILADGEGIASHRPQVEGSMRKWVEAETVGTKKPYYTRCWNARTRAKVKTQPIASNHCQIQHSQKAQKSA